MKERCAQSHARTDCGALVALSLHIVYHKPDSWSATHIHMIRFILAGLAVLLAALAFATGQSWLYAAAGGTGGVALGLVVYGLWVEHRPGAGVSAGDADTREALGISKVRPMAPPDEETESSEAPSASEASSSNGTSSSAAASPPAQESASERTPPSASKAESDDTTSQTPPSSGPAGEPAGDPRVEAFVRSLRHVLQAHTVALLVQEEMALDYRIAGLDSDNPSAQRSGMFSTSHPLLTARMSHSDVTVRDLDDEPRMREALNYYAEAGVASTLQTVALAPIKHAQQSATYFLIADGTANVPLGHKHTKRLLAQSAEILGRLLAYDPTSLRPTIAESTGSDASSSAHAAHEPAGATESDSGGEEMVDMTTPSPEVERQGPRPRIEIIAEEMEVARATDIPLALALVHLNRADMISERGHDAVEQVESILHETLEEAAPHQRVERFGELTYGVFYQADLSTVEAWTLDLHRGMLRATGTLKGGVSIGVGMMRARHETATDLRSEVMQALHEAYKSGTPVIID